MANKLLSAKRLQIDKANASMVIVMAVSAFVSVFCLIGSKTLLSQRSYQAKVIKEKKVALNQLKSNNQAVSELVNTYKAFVDTPENIIGGTKTGTGERDGDNAKIVLDALPSKYDFPALAASLDKIFTSKTFKLNSIGGTDDELNQSKAQTTNVPVEIPIQVSVSGSYNSIKDLLDVLYRSIRPIKIKSLSLSGTDSELTVSIDGKTYYLPEKTIKITTKEVKR